MTNVTPRVSFRRPTYTPDDIAQAEALLDDIRSSDPNPLSRIALINSVMSARGMKLYEASMLVEEWRAKRGVLLKRTDDDDVQRRDEWMQTGHA